MNLIVGHKGNFASVNEQGALKVGGGSTFSESHTRPDNTTVYTTLDVWGTDPAANIEFDDVGNAEDTFIILGVRLRFDVAAIPTGMTNFRLHLYNAAPTAIADNAAFNLIAADRGKYLGYITIGGAVDLGDTVWMKADDVNFSGKLASDKLYGVLQTIGAITPTAETVTTVTLNMAVL